MRHKIIATLVTAVCYCSPAMAADSPEVNMNPGLWEWKTEMDIPNMPKNMPPAINKRCLTKKDLVPASKKPGHECDIKELKTSNEGVTWTMTCTSPQGPVTSTGKMFYNGDSAHGEVKVNTQSIMMLSKISGKRLGPCRQSETK